MKNGKALCMYSAAMAIYGTIGIFRRMLPLSSAMLAFTRGIIGGLFLLGWTMLRGKRLQLGKDRRKAVLLALTGGLIGLNWILLFEAYNYTSVAVATLCYYMQPTFLILLSPLVFRERLGLLSGLCALISLAGMVLISGILGAVPSPGDLTGILLGLGAAVLYTTVVILNKKTQVPDSASKTIVQLFSAALILIPYLLLSRDMSFLKLTPPTIGLTLFVGIVHTGVAYAMYFGSMGELSSRTVAVLGYLDPVLALILSWAVLHETMSPVQWLGALLIIGAALCSELAPRRSQSV